MPANGSSEAPEQGKLRSTSWCWTFYREDSVHALRSCPHRAFVCAEEVGGTGGMKHYQGYIRFENPTRESWFKNQFRGYVEHPTELGEDGTPKRYWNHWEVAKGGEKMARLYIVDVARWLEVTKRPHPKEQGTVLFDYGCAIPSSERGSTEQTVIQMVVDRAPLWQVFREHPVFYFRQRRRIVDLDLDVQQWHESGVDYAPRERGIKRPREDAEANGS